MKNKQKSVMRVASAALFALVFAFLPLGNAYAATAKTWVNNSTTGNMSTAANWSPSGALADGDSIIFDSRKWDLSTWVSAGVPNLTNPSNPTIAGLSAVGGTGTCLSTGYCYEANINQLKVAAGATVSSSDGTRYMINIDNLTAVGDVTIDGIVANNVDAAGNITLKNSPSSSNSLAFNFGNYKVASGKMLILGSGTTLLDNTDLSTDYTIQVDTGAKLYLGSAAFDHLNIIMNGGLLVAGGASPATVKSVTLLADSTYQITNTDTGKLTIETLTVNGKSFTSVDQGRLVVINTVAGTTVTPAAPNTAFSLILTNPITIALAMVAAIGAGIGIMRLRKQQ